MRYRHFKGNEYTVLTVGRHTETGEDLVVYTDHPGTVWVRPKSMFVDMVGDERRFAPVNDDPVATGFETPTYAELLVALEQSVKLQSHYARLCNDYDAGERIVFPSAAAWLARLRELKCQQRPASAAD